MSVFYMIIFVLVVLATFTLWAYLSYEDAAQNRLKDAEKQLISQGMTKSEFEVSYEIPIARALKVISPYPISKLSFTKDKMEVSLGLHVDSYVANPLITDLRNAGYLDISRACCEGGYTSISIEL